MYDAEKNFKIFLRQHNIYDRVIEILEGSAFGKRIKQLRAEGKLDKVFVEYTEYRTDGFYGFINYMCTWADQDEGGQFWSDLHEKWGAICAAQIELKPPPYKSIW